MPKPRLKTTKGLPVLKAGQAVRATLRPYDDHKAVQVSAKIAITPGGQIEISVAGYGDCTSEDGYGSPILIELAPNLRNDKHPLTVRLWSDINKEDPTHIIDMSEALEENRSKA